MLVLMLVDECRQLDINELRRWGMLTPGYAYRVRWWEADDDDEQTETAALGVIGGTMRINLVY